MNIQQYLIGLLVERYQRALEDRNIEADKIKNKNSLYDIDMDMDGELFNDFEGINGLLNNKYDKNYLEYFNCDGEKITYCHEKWNCHTIPCAVSRILLKTLLIKHLICKNNLGLPNEIWEIICDLIEDDIKYYVPAFIDFDYDIDVYLNKEKCINLKDKFINGHNLIRNPIKILKYINVGDIIIDGYLNWSCYFSIIVNIDVNHGLITVINDNFDNNHCLCNGEYVLDLKGPRYAKIFYFYDFLFMSSIQTDTQVFIYKTHL